MFSVADRERVRRRLLRLAEDDSAIVGAAIVGSLAADGGDRWSDIDLAFAVDGEIAEPMRRWTETLYRDFGAVHHWDLTSGHSVYRVFLLPGALEVDISFTPEPGYGPRGAHWRLVFGSAGQPRPAPPEDAQHLAGLAWHHALHAYISVERRRWWQAEHWIAALRTQVVALASRRFGLPTSYAKGAHVLPPDAIETLEPTLVRSLDEAELRRALRAAIDALSAELDATDAPLAGRLRPMLVELADETGTVR